MTRRIKEWIKNHDVWLISIGYIVIAIGLITFLPSNYFPAIYHLPKIFTYLLILIAPVLILLISGLILLLSYAILGLGYLMLLIPYGLMILIYGLFTGIMLLVAGIAVIIEHLFHNRINLESAILISFSLIGIITIFCSIGYFLFQIF